jgi:magnesium chelatase family protein
MWARRPFFINKKAEADMEIVSFSRYGYEGEIIKVEADLRRGIPATTIVGLPDGAVREACERMRAAIRNSGFEFPRDRILINLSPADLKKEGSSFDLPIALAVLGAADTIPGIPAGDENGSYEDNNVPVSGARGNDTRLMVLGELELSGTVRPVRGILSAVSRGLAEGITRFIVPEGNFAEATIHRNACVTGVSNLVEAIAVLRTMSAKERRKDTSSSGTGFVVDGDSISRNTIRAGTDGSRAVMNEYNPARFPELIETAFEDIRGQPVLVRALEIAAAGGHHLIAYGPPGCGKTLAIKRIPALLPFMDSEMAVAATRIHSIAGILPESGALLDRPPFRDPHPGASLEGMTGGGRRLTPGEISLAHGGVLFLDEAALFRASVLQSLRTPLETGSVTISRAGAATTFPARFQLLMAINPCPCGNYGAPNSVCTCLPDAVERYWRRLAAPLLDRIDLRIAVSQPDARELAAGSTVSTAELRNEIGRARGMQWERAGRLSRETGWLNAHLAAGDIARYCILGSNEEKLFLRCMELTGFSGRAGHGILKVARTIADLAGESAIGEDHVLEAVQLRRWGPFVPDFLRDER